MKKEKIHFHYLNTEIVLNHKDETYTVKLKHPDGTAEKHDIDQDAISETIIRELDRIEKHNRAKELKEHIKNDIHNGIHLLEIEYSNIYGSDTMLIKSKIAHPTHRQLREFIPEIAQSSIDDITDDTGNPSLTYMYISDSFDLSNYEKWPILE